MPNYDSQLHCWIDSVILFQIIKFTFLKPASLLAKGFFNKSISLIAKGLPAQTKKFQEVNHLEKVELGTDIMHFVKLLTCYYRVQTMIINCSDTANNFSEIMKTITIGKILDAHSTSQL